MTRRFTFPDTDQGRLWFWYGYLALARRGDPAQGTKQSKADHRSEAKIVRALNAISEPLPGSVPPLAGMPDNRVRGLKTGAWVIALEQPDFKRLQDYLEATQWDATLTADLADLQDALETAEKIEP